ncbi:MAG TPA: NAD-dependent epimerase/dehydratase [Pyrinomonadaceae bacterium]|nr:NAD-dependent epimerase/dehydratase [Pyrinomonadaceae bacterium]
MKLAITGPLGHIGSRLIHDLTSSEASEVVLIDNLSTQRYCSLFNLREGVNWRFIQADVTTGDLEDLFAGADVVIHLAAMTNAAESFEIEEEVERVNYFGTERVALATAKVGSPLIFLSTTSVYGVSEGLVTEADPAQVNPQSPYAKSKLEAERFIARLGETSGLKFFIGRFGTIYGASIGMRFHTAVNKFVWQACVGQPLTVWSTALDQKRPYLDVYDAVRALKFVMQRELYDNQIYNLLTDNLTVRDIVETIKRHVPQVKVELVDARIMNQLSYTVDRSKFVAHGFQFEGDVERGVSESIAKLKALTASERWLHASL